MDTVGGRRAAGAVSTIAGLCVVAGLLVSAAFAGPSVTHERTAPAARTACAPSAVILESPRAASMEVQAKALNDRGDVVGFADSNGGKGPIHAILWKGGRTAAAVDLGVLPGYVASEAYGVNDDRVVFGLLYDRKERTYPFRWEAGRMTVLTGPDGRRRPVDVPDRNVINDRGQIAGTLIDGGRRQAVRGSPDGKATLLPALAGHTWTNVWSINGDGVVSGWSRKLPNDVGENNPVIWDASGKVIPLKTTPGRADGAAEATNRSGLIVGYLGNLGTDGMPGVADTDPERGNAVVWRSRTATPLFLGRPAPAHFIAELVDVNDRGQAVGMSGELFENGFALAEPRIWRTGWTSLRPLPIPAAARKSRVLVTQLHDVNGGGDIVGNVFGLAGRDYSMLRRIDPVLWRCAFSG